MRKIFRKIEKAMNKVADATGLKSVRQSIGRAWKKNKWIRYVVIAAAVYFTAGAALGAMGAIGAGGGFWGGVGAGLQSAGAGLVNGSFLGGAYGAGAGTVGAGAGSAAGAAGAAVGAGEGAAAGLGAAEGATAAGALEGAGAVGAAEGAATSVAGSAYTPLSQSVTSLGANVSLPSAAQVAPPAAKSAGLLSSVSNFAASPGGGLVTSAGLKLAGGYMSDRAQAKERERAEQLMQEERDRINNNQNVSGINFNAAAVPPLNQVQQQMALRPFSTAQGIDPYQQNAPGLMGQRVAL